MYIYTFYKLTTTNLPFDTCIHSHAGLWEAARASETAPKRKWLTAYHCCLIPNMHLACCVISQHSQEGTGQLLFFLMSFLWFAFFLKSRTKNCLSLFVCISGLYGWGHRSMLISCLLVITIHLCITPCWSYFDTTTSSLIIKHWLWPQTNVSYSNSYWLNV